MIGLRFPRTIGLALITLICGQLIGAVLGVYAAVNQYKIGDTLATIFAFTGIVIPKFVVALVILYLLAFVWHSPYIGAISVTSVHATGLLGLAKIVGFLETCLANTLHLNLGWTRIYPEDDAREFIGCDEDAVH